MRTVGDVLAGLPTRPLLGPWATQDAYQRWIATSEPEVAGRTRPDLQTTGPLVSVVVPVFRPEYWFLARCLNSVAKQRYRNWELCLCDDGSEDPKLTSFLEGVQAAEGRVRLTRFPKNRGIAAACNAAVALGTGPILAFLDHDDLLHEDALAEVAAAFEDPETDVAYSDSDRVDDLDVRFELDLKPDWAPDLLLARPYLSHLLCLRRDLLAEIGGFRSAFDGSQDYDVMLRATERARKVTHIPRVLYHWRAVTGSVAKDANAKPWALTASRRALEDCLERRGIDARVDEGPVSGTYHVRRRVREPLTVSFVLAPGDWTGAAQRRLTSLVRLAGHPVSEIVAPGPCDLPIAATSGVPVRQVRWHEGFGLAESLDRGASGAASELLVFLSSDLECRRAGWLRAMVEHGQREDVGAVGARLLHPNGTIAHAGMVLGLLGLAGPLFDRMDADYHHWGQVARPFSAVSGACFLTSRALFRSLDGFDEKLAGAYFDVDYCLRAREAGYQVLYTPLAELVDHRATTAAYAGDAARHLLGKWNASRFFDDPLHHRALSLFAANWSLRPADEQARWQGLVGSIARA